MRKLFSRLAHSTRLRKGARGKSKGTADGAGTTTSSSQPSPADNLPLPIPEGAARPNTPPPPQQQPGLVAPADLSAVDPPAYPAPEHSTTTTTNTTTTRLLTIEDLPPELRRLILALLATADDAPSLRALVSASPVFYQQYLLDRKPLLRAVLRTARGVPLADAHALQASTRLLHYPPDGSADAGAIRGFVDAYRDGLRARMPAEVVLAEQCTEEDLVGMVWFYVAVARPLVRKCAGLFLGRLKPAPELGVLSAMEETRLLRGLYRYQVYCNMFGQGARGRREVPELEFHGEQLELFFCLFEPWEIDEIYCVYVLIRDVYGWVMDRMEAGVDGEKVDFKDWRPPLAGSKKDLRNDPHRCSLLEGAALRGLSPFYRLIKEDDDERRAAMLQSYLVDGAGNIEHALGRPNQRARRSRQPQDGDAIEAAWGRLTFDGDIENRPPLAWVIYWKGHVVNRYGDALEPPVQRWGHVFWDNKRLVKSQGLKELLRERERFRRW